MKGKKNGPALEVKPVQKLKKQCCHAWNLFGGILCFGNVLT